MQLPEIKHPTFTIVIPSTKEKKKFRPFVVKEEKILLMGQQSKDPKDMYEAIKQVINNCAVDTLDFDVLAPFDFDYIFVKLRSQSVSNVIDVKYRDPEDDQEYDMKVNLNEVEVTFPEDSIDPIVECTDNIKIKLKHPTMAVMDSIMHSFGEVEDVTSNDLVDKLITKSIECVMAGEEIYPTKEATDEQLVDFVNNLPMKSYEKIRKFFENVPQLKHTISYTNSKGTEKSIELNGLGDFFTF